MRVLQGLLLAAAAAAEQIVFQRKLTGRFLHISDVHPDRFYTPGAKLMDMCHLEPSDAKKKKDHHDARAGYWGPDPGSECDTPIQLVNATLDFIDRAFVQQGGVDFVVWTGDSARHDNDNRYPRTLPQIYELNHMMTQGMHRVFGTDRFKESTIPVIPTIGNNDVWPHNLMFPGPSKTIAKYKELWKLWIPPEQIHTFDRGAYFHVSVAPKLTVISLNSIFFYENNAAVEGCSVYEPGSLQLDWLEIQLRIFRQQNIKVWIIGHVPPTNRQWYDDCFDRYANLVVEYRDLVIGQLFGHVNIDHFYFMEYQQQKKVKAMGNPLQILLDVRDDFDALPPATDNLEHLAVVNVGPSVVPNFYPTLRVYDYETNPLAIDKKRKKKRKKTKLPPVAHLGPAHERQLYTPLKYTQYYLNLTAANAEPKAPIEYQIEYDTTAQPYAMPDLTLSSWVKLGKELSGLHGQGKFTDKDFCQTDPLLTALPVCQGHKSAKKKKRNDDYWDIFIYRGLVSTGLEKELRDDL
ncbi:Metallo-dependent phosphatase-like protein [Protomyces lactucae-debilis]|uniref:Endopolyphosphatase n=1 Tax=Protomyces lactucae-debilis TaxID=2754530 RepID=A0A1Y2F484_PROLT|nr:Metallo-dependent phosphatase-like protein [Protomyces lactucae-debilis]ORY78497.1 Metallo-dependent phosphatase-like protein [Protomyces lactucae-debilis]